MGARRANERVVHTLWRSGQGLRPCSWEERAKEGERVRWEAEEEEEEEEDLLTVNKE